MHLCFVWELQRLSRDCSNAHTRLSFRCSHMQSFDCVFKLSMTSKCPYVLNGGSKGSGETAQMRRLVWAFWLLAHAIKTTVDCVSMSSKCTYVLNGSGETAQVRRLVWAFVAWSTYILNKSSKDSGETFFADSSKVGSPWRVFPRGWASEYILILERKMLERYKMRPLFPPFSFNFQENVYFRFLKLHRRKSRKTYALFVDLNNAIQWIDIMSLITDWKLVSLCWI